MNTAIIGLSVLVGFFFLKETSRLSVNIFCFGCLLFNMVGHFIPPVTGTLYYIGAGLTDLFIIYILSELSRPTKITVQIQTICKWFIGANFIGWVLFMNYLPPKAYTSLCTILYAWLLMEIILSGEKNVIGGTAMDSRDTHIYSNYYPSYHKISRNKNEARY